jgi:hypothetical protein
MQHHSRTVYLLSPFCSSVTASYPLPLSDMKLFIVLAFANNAALLYCGPYLNVPYLSAIIRFLY